MEEIDRHGKSIEKVHAESIFEERLKIKDETMTRWEAFNQRAGARKLDPTAEYASTYSEKWGLSINTIRERK